MTIVMRNISSLVPYARNPRKNDDAIDRMCASIREFGFKIPVLAKTDGTVIDGHLRLKAAQQLGIAEIPVIVCDDWTEAQVKAFRLLVNRSVSWADWDEELLRLEFEDLKSLDFDLSLTGFELPEIDTLLASAPTVGLTDEDAAPEIPAEPITISGDLWILGSHRLLCGDCTRIDDVQRILNGVIPNLMVTDPPYGVNYQPAWRNQALGEGNRSIGTVSNDDKADWREAWGLFPGDVAYIWHAGTKAAIVAESLEACNFQIRSQIIWAKQHFAISRGHYHVQHEPCWYAVRKSKTGHWHADRKQTTLWEINNGLSQGGPREAENELTGHGTQKPVECMRRPILNHTDPGQCVYDPFVGSGTTIIAAETTSRMCFAIDIDPKYVDVAVRRWEDFTGKKATLESSGNSFEKTARRRVRQVQG
jgi:DNA modification methylase